MLALTRRATAVGLVLLAASLGTVAAQPPEKVPRVGYISPGASSEPLRLRRFEAFRQGLRELGYVEGRNVVLEPRWAEGEYERYPALAADLVRLKVTSSWRWVGVRRRSLNKRRKRYQSSCRSSSILWEVDSSPALRAPGGTSRG
jgi:hypothetical protein